VKARFDGIDIMLGRDGQSLYEQSGYGRKEGEGLRISSVEALYLVSRNKIEFEGYNFEDLLMRFMENTDFLREYLVYRDMRERGYVIQSGPHDFRVFRRGEKPGHGRSQYLIRVLSEREYVSFENMITDVKTASNMRKQYILSVVDDEDELTYYEVKIQSLKSTGAAFDIPEIKGIKYGRSVITEISPEIIPENAWFGTKLDKTHLMLSPVETSYLLGKDVLKKQDLQITIDEYIEEMLPSDEELYEKVQVYSDLRELGYTPRTAYKFGHHFRVYSGHKKHSELLVHAMPAKSRLPMSVISRSVRLAHSVRKKMLFACVDQNNIQYIEFARIKL